MTYLFLLLLLYFFSQCKIYDLLCNDIDKKIGNNISSEISNKGGNESVDGIGDEINSGIDNVFPCDKLNNEAKSVMHDTLGVTTQCTETQPPVVHLVTAQVVRVTIVDRNFTVGTQPLF